MITHNPHVRAELEQPTSESENRKDYVRVLNENLELFRTIENLKKNLEEISNVNVAALEAQHEAEIELLKEKAKHQQPQTYKSIRKKLIWCYFVISFIMTIFPPGLYVWFYYLGYKIEPEIIVILDILGFLGLVVTGFWVDLLADKEKEPS